MPTVDVEHWPCNPESGWTLSVRNNPSVRSIYCCIHATPYWVSIFHKHIRVHSRSFSETDYTINNQEALSIEFQLCTQINKQTASWAKDVGSAIKHHQTTFVELMNERGRITLPYSMLSRMRKLRLASNSLLRKTSKQSIAKHGL